MLLKINLLACPFCFAPERLMIQYFGGYRLAEAVSLGPLILGPTTTLN